MPTVTKEKEAVIIFKESGWTREEPSNRTQPKMNRFDPHKVLDRGIHKRPEHEINTLVQCCPDRTRIQKFM